MALNTVTTLDSLQVVNSGKTLEAASALILEDDEDALVECRDGLVSAGFSVLIAKSTHSALELFIKSTDIGVILVDIQLPGLDGLNFIGEVRRIHREKVCPEFIVMTGHASVETAVSALRLEVSDFLQKPIELRQLQRAALVAVIRYQARSMSSPHESPESLTVQSDPVLKVQGGSSTLAHVKSLIKSMQRRNAVLGAGLFIEPAWLMLLELYLAHLQNVRISVSALCVSSGATHATALRRIDDLTKLGLVVRKNDESDKRRANIFLTTEGVEKISRLLPEIFKT